MARATFYYQLKQLCKTDKHADVRALITAIYHFHKGRYGYRRITLALRNEGLEINLKAVERLMRQDGLKSMVRAKKYRSPVMDLYNIEIISYTISKHPNLFMVTSMVNKALKNIDVDNTQILQSDQGWHYQNRTYQTILKDKGVT